MTRVVLFVVFFGMNVFAGPKLAPNPLESEFPLMATTVKELVNPNGRFNSRAEMGGLIVARMRQKHYREQYIQDVFDMQHAMLAGVVEGYKKEVETGIHDGSFNPRFYTNGFENISSIQGDRGVENALKFGMFDRVFDAMVYMSPEEFETFKVLLTHELLSSDALVSEMNTYRNFLLQDPKEEITTTDLARALFSLPQLDWVYFSKAEHYEKLSDEEKSTVRLLILRKMELIDYVLDRGGHDDYAPSVRRFFSEWERIAKQMASKGYPKMILDPIQGPVLEMVGKLTSRLSKSPSQCEAVFQRLLTPH